MTTITKRYDELKEGDIIVFHGAKERITKITTYPAPANEWYPEEKTVYFDLEPADAAAREALGGYAFGTYGGVGCLLAEYVFPYGVVNGKGYLTRDEFVFAKRRFGAIEDDAALLEYAEKVTSGWQEAGHCRTFTQFYLGDYALSEPKQSVTAAEYERLKELQAEARRAERDAEAAKEWRLLETVGYADNSIEERWINKFGEEKVVMTVYPHGDAC